MVQKKDISISRPVFDLLGVALGELEIKTSAIGRAYGEAVDVGSAHHESGPGEFWRQELIRATDKLTELKETHRIARVYEPSTDQQQVQLGSGVAVVEVFSGRGRIESAYTVVSPTDVLVCARLRVTHPASWISTETTRGAALMNRHLGDSDIRVKVPDGEIRMAVTRISSGDFSLVLPTKSVKGGEKN